MGRRLRRGGDLMTEAEWQTGTDPHLLLECLHDGVSDRKLRLFAAACCRRLWPLLTQGRSRRAVETSERHADGLAGDEELKAAYRPAAWLEDTVVPPWAVQVAAEAAAANAAYEDAPDAAVRAALWALDATAGAAADAVADPPGSLDGPHEGHRWFRIFQAVRVAEKEAQCRLLRCLVGNPFRPVSPPPAWRTWRGGTVVRLAEQIYEGRRFGDLPVLADALEEAGCTDPDLLAHCRSAEEHARGCWVLDLVLGKDWGTCRSGVSVVGWVEPCETHRAVRGSPVPAREYGI